MYGARGWVAHHNTDLWRADRANRWSALGLVADRRRLALPASLGPLRLRPRSQPIFGRDLSADEGAAQFSSTRWSRSPRNRLAGDVALVVARKCASSWRVDCAPVRPWTVQIFRDLFVDASPRPKSSQSDAELAPNSRRRVRDLAPDQVGRNGQLQEWLEDWDDGSAGARSPTCLPSLRLVPERPNQCRRRLRARPAAAAARLSCAAISRPVGRSRGDSIFGRVCTTASTRTRCSSPARPRAHLSQHVRCPPAVSDRRQFRRHPRHRGDAAAEWRGDRAVASITKRVAGRIGHRAAHAAPVGST